MRFTHQSFCFKSVIHTQICVFISKHSYLLYSSADKNYITQTTYVLLLWYNADKITLANTVVVLEKHVRTHFIIPLLSVQSKVLFRCYITFSVLLKLYVRCTTPYVALLTFPSVDIGLICAYTYYLMRWMIGINTKTKNFTHYRSVLDYSSFHNCIPEFTT